MKKLLLTTALLFLFISCSSPDDRPFDQLETTLQETVTNCRACHDQGQVTGAPNIFGLQSWHLREQVIKFKAGARGGDLATVQAQAMHQSVKNIPEDDLIAAARWFAGQERPAFKATIQGNAKIGESLYQENCASCHNKAFLKIVTHSPEIDKLEDWYFVQQCNNFDQGFRGGDLDNDHGKSMKEKIKRVKKENFKDLAAYLQSLK